MNKDFKKLLQSVPDTYEDFEKFMLMVADRFEGFDEYMIEYMKKHSEADTSELSYYADGFIMPLLESADEDEPDEDE